MVDLAVKEPLSILRESVMIPSRVIPYGIPALNGSPAGHDIINGH